MDEFRFLLVPLPNEIGRMRKSQFLIGAATSGSGKTTLTLGLLRAFARAGLRVRPFKCGPDYIDPHYHALAAGIESINLDPFMASAAHLRQLYGRYGAAADLCIAEGAMGLFDGYRADAGSAAEVALRLSLPVVLLVDARASAYSAAPLLYGYKHFRPEMEIAGVVFNRVGSESHYTHLKEAARDAGVEALGYLPRDDAFAAPSRHLGLSLDNLAAFEPTVDAIADAVERHIDLERLLARTERPFAAAAPRPAAPRGAKRIAVARDEAFDFIYRANLDRLAELGEVRFFSPLRDEALPAADPDLVYLPGGYPEFFLDELAANEPMRRTIRSYAESGGRLLAECGGMMYLCRTIRSAEGLLHPMCGVLPLDATMEGMRLHLGYREVVGDGWRLRGHEFHYSRIEGELPSAARQYSARGTEVATPLYQCGNVVAGYTHLYWAEHDPFELFD